MGDPNETQYELQLEAHPEVSDETEGEPEAKAEETLPQPPEPL